MLISYILNYYFYDIGPKYKNNFMEVINNHGNLK